MKKISFIKMHGCGNDFIIIDNRKLQYIFFIEQVKHISDRHFGVGCDQFVLIENSNNADCAMKIYNNDGSISGMCGNASRCVAKIIMEESNKSEITLEVGNKILTAKQNGEHITIEMGEPSFAWDKIPLSQDFPDILSLPIEFGKLKNPSAVNIGNPHMVFFVDNIDEFDLDIIGKELEYHPYFPEQANITIAQVISQTHIRMKVWERGVWETLACGSAACASFAAAYYKNLVSEEALVTMPGGELNISIKNKNIYMRGPAEISFLGNLEL